VTIDTTPRDLIYSSANILSHDIEPSTALLLESYNQLGLERRIRRYEHIRDVMNSWDRDTQNCFYLQPSDSPNNEKDLELSSVPREQPGDFSVCMYHSQKPGKWNKRYITLLSSGQIFISKKSGAKVTDKDVMSICHLSDFDIYTPTPSQLRKVLRPPKKICYAIKSQQKTAVFLSTDNFVHFFCTSNEVLADQWYSAVQRWRSWYLVNKMGDGQKRTNPSANQGNHSKISADGNPYTIGSFAPLLDMGDLNPSSKQNLEPVSDASDDDDRPLQIPFHLRHGLPPPRPRPGPPVSYPKVNLPASGNAPLDRGPLLKPDEPPFASNGLLGRSYSQRQKAQREREVESKETANGLVVEGPPLRRTSIDASHPPLHSHQRTMSLRRPPTSSGQQNSLGRTGSVKRPNLPKPLIDLTPTFKEAPQWSKEGKGRGVAAPQGIPLVEAAHSTWEAVGVDLAPQTTMFRREDSRPPVTRGDERGRDRAESRPRTAARGRVESRSRVRDRDRDRDEAFIRGGLLDGVTSARGRASERD
jgi:hypothetical protein